MTACGFLVEHRRLKEKSKQAVILRLPPLEMLETIQTKMTHCGITTLGMGILTGFCWAYREGWSVLTDPKILMTVGVFLMYLAMALAHRRLGFSSRRYSALVIAGFVICLISFFTLNFLSHGRHHF